MKKIIISCALAFISYFNISGQYNSTLIFNSQDYPALSDLYEIFIDSRGEIWLGTYANGLIHFNGREFKNYKPLDGFVSSQAIQIFEDKKGSIWAGSAERGFSMLVKDKFKNFYVSEFGLKYFDRVYYDNNSKTVHCLAKNKGSYLFDYKTNSFAFQSDQSFEVRHCDEPAIYRNDYTSYFQFYKDSCYYFIKGQLVKQFKKIPWEQHYPSLLIDNMLYYAQEDSLYSFCLDDSNKRRQTNISILPGKVSNITRVEDHLLICCKKNASEQIIIEYDLCMNYLTKYTIKSPFTIYKIAKDKAGNFWGISSNSLIKINISLIEFPITQTNMLSAVTSVVTTPDQKIWFASDANGIAYFDGKKIHSCDSINKWNSSYLNCSFVDKDGQVNFNMQGSKPGILVLRNDKSAKWINRGFISFYSGRTQGGNLILGMGNYEGIWISKTDPIQDIPNNFIKIGHQKGLQLVNVLTVSEDLNGNFWMGRTSQGIAVYDFNRDTFYHYLKSDSVFVPGCLSSIVDNRGNIWLGTDNGLYFVDSDQFETSKLKFESFGKQVATKIIGTSIVGSLAIKDSILYIGNALGIFLLDLKEFYNHQMHVQTIDKNFGYSGGAVGQNAFHFDENNNILWLYGSENVSGFYYKKYVQDTLTPSIKLEYLEHNNGEQVKLFEGILLPKGTSSFNLRVSAENSPYLYPNIHYSYSLNNQPQSPLQTSPLLEIRNLSPGNHKMKVWAVKNGNNYSIPVEISFRIRPNWWENKWLWWLFGSVLAVSLLILYRKNLQTLKQNSEIINLKYNHILEKKQRDNLRIQAIISQLNPHFIKNVLHWVSIRIANDKDSTRVLSKLSKNIQLVFENTKDNKSHHKLEGELEILRNYLLIQKYRFGDKFDYELPNPEVLLPYLNQEVPLMILQIHCENACEHGVKHLSNRKGIIKIKLQDEPDFMHFSVEDNGIGRARAKTIESQGTQQGVKMLEELMAIYNEANVLKMRQWYEDDIFEKDGVCYGTRVNIRIPKNYYFEIE